MDTTYEELEKHQGHTILCYSFTRKDGRRGILLECHDCEETLLMVDAPEENNNNEDEQRLMRRSQG